MTVIRFIGDVHSKWTRYKKLIKSAPDKKSLQVGDFGVGFRNSHGDWLSNPPYTTMKSGEHRFIRGNHDNPAVCRGQTLWVADGFTCFNGSIFCVGGAESYDKHLRNPGLDWWEDEELSYPRLQQIIDVYSELKPSIVVTHDASNEALALATHYKELRIGKATCGRRTRAAFDAMLEIHRPKVWVNGHWHIRWDHEFRGTRFIGLEELGVTDLEVDC